ncbi:hypothetical protein [Halolamina salina]|uniref:Uncharacterized protein n=1 Tax=Halolamina salina TaxID=1220023 RepID=A0ABD6B5D2_9EURY
MGENGGDESSDASGGEARRRAADASGEDETVPRVDLGLRELSVSVTGRSDDDLEAVAESAQDLMGYLVAEADGLEDDHDEYGLS